ncbi:hypothetical protein NPIL_548961 [Nephila pilipes]|uniref:Uncharacterized protein n=1 Tax=Nephila pilipes TaxID=299642 RepID=A0A8X6QN63_NEPPI|nr:hypothetical protein NPIL_548961 [Nephila pilipes]
MVNWGKLTFLLRRYEECMKFKRQAKQLEEASSKISANPFSGRAFNSERTLCSTLRKKNTAPQIEFRFQPKLNER